MVRLGNKGLLRIPVYLLKELNLREGSVLHLDVEDGKIVLRPRIARSSCTGMVG